MRCAFAVAVFVAFLPRSAAATPIVIQHNGVATGIKGLLVAQTLYDVFFEFGTYAEVFQNDEPTFLIEYHQGLPGSFGSTTARQASFQISQVLTQAAITGVGPNNSRQFIIPFTIDPWGTIYAVQADLHTAPSIPYFWISDGSAPAFGHGGTYAVFRAVPEPPAWLLTVVGLVTMVLWRGRRVHHSVRVS
jgi:hypothetical protein